MAAVAPGRGCEKPPPPRAGCPASVAAAAAPAAVGIAGMRAGGIDSGAAAAAGWAPGSPPATRLKSKTLGAGRLGRAAASADAPGAGLRDSGSGVGCSLDYIHHPGRRVADLAGTVGRCGLASPGAWMFCSVPAAKRLRADRSSRSQAALPDIRLLSPGWL